MPTLPLTPERIRATLAASSTPAFKLAFATLLILAALGTTYLSSEDNFPAIELRDVLTRGMAASAVLLLGALAVGLRSKVGANVALALITTAGIFTAYLVHTELFHPANRAWLIIVCLGVMFALYVAFRLMDDFRWGGLALSGVAVLPLAAFVCRELWPMFWPQLTDGVGTLGDLLDPGSPRVWGGLLGLCAGSALALYLISRVRVIPRWGAVAILATAFLLSSALIWPRLWPRLLEGVGTPGGLFDLSSPMMWVGLLGLCACSALVLYLMFRAADPSRWGVFAVLGIALFLVGSLTWLGHGYEEGSDDYYANGWDSHPNVRAVTFEETPNLYFIGFESIVPESIMYKHMGIETTQFHRVLEDEMRRFRNMFASAVHTWNSFQTLMALDLDIVLEHRAATRSSPSYFAGHDLSPLVWIMRENGYTTSSFYQTRMFGRTQGLGIDNYKINTTKDAVCSLLDGRIRPWAFWGYCPEENVSHLPFEDYLMRELTKIDVGRPQFVIAHNPLPGHTSSLFDPDDIDDRKEFFDGYARNSNRAAIYLERIIEHLKATDPNAILFVFGDHGALLAHKAGLEDDPTFFLQDRFGILGGVYPPDRCAAELDEAESKGYVTTLDVVHAILECLSGGQSALREPRHDRFWGDYVPESHSYKHEDFLYE